MNNAGPEKPIPLRSRKPRVRASAPSDSWGEKAVKEMREGFRLLGDRIDGIAQEVKVERETRLAKDKETKERNDARRAGDTVIAHIRRDQEEKDKADGERWDWVIQVAAAVIPVLITLMVSTVAMASQRQGIVLAGVVVAVLAFAAVRVKKKGRLW